MIDIVALEDEILARLRAEVLEFAFGDTSENLDEELMASCNKPAVFTHVKEPSAAELAAGIKGQKIELEATIGILTQSLSSRSAASKGDNGTRKLKQKTKKALHWWKPAAALEKMKYRGEDDPLRQGALAMRQLRFSLSIHEQYT